MRPDDRLRKDEGFSIRVRGLRCTLMHLYCAKRLAGLCEVAQERSKSSACCGPKWSDRAQRVGRRTSSRDPPKERHHSFFFVYYSLYLSRALVTIWDRGVYASVDLCVCARYLCTSQFSSRKFESNNDGGKLERFNPLGGWRLHMSERERDQRKGRQIRPTMVCRAISICRDGRNIVFFIWITVQEQY